MKFEIEEENFKEIIRCAVNQGVRSGLETAIDIVKAFKKAYSNVSVDEILKAMEIAWRELNEKED